jgi:hypothetical protein
MIMIQPCPFIDAKNELRIADRRQAQDDLDQRTCPREQAILNEAIAILSPIDVVHKQALEDIEKLLTVTKDVEPQRNRSDTDEIHS